MSDQAQNPNLKLNGSRILEPMPEEQRRALHALKVGLLHEIQRQDAAPEVAITAMLSLIGAVIGTRLYPHAEQEKWIAQAITTLPAYVEAYRVRELKLPTP